MEILAIIGAVAKLSSVVAAIMEAAPTAIETIQAGAKAYELIKKVITKDPVEVSQSELDAINAMAEALEGDIINEPIAPPEQD